MFKSGSIWLLTEFSHSIIWITCYMRATVVTCELSECSTTTDWSEPSLQHHITYHMGAFSSQMITYYDDLIIQFSYLHFCVSKFLHQLATCGKMSWVVNKNMFYIYELYDTWQLNVWPIMQEKISLYHECLKRSGDGCH